MQAEPASSVSGAYTGEVADLYNLIHEARGKDYLAEAKEVLRLATEQATSHTSLLDVACGTGLHLEAWQSLVGHVEGVDLSPDMCAIAESRLPGTRIHEKDMRNFKIGRQFDVVTCLFSSIGHLATSYDLESAYRNFANHLATGGTMLVEPWWFPERFISGYVSAATINTGWGAVSRVSHTTRRGNISTIEVQYLVGHREHGITQLREEHALPLVTLEEHLHAFDVAGLSAEYVESPIFERGIFLAQHRRDQGENRCATANATLSDVTSNSYIRSHYEQTL